MLNLYRFSTRRCLALRQSARRAAHQRSNGANASAELASQWTTQWGRTSLVNALPFPVRTNSLFGELPVRVGRMSLFAATEADMPFLRRLFRSVREEELALTGWPESAKDAFCNSQFDLQHTHYVRHFPQAAFLLVREATDDVGRLYVDASSSNVHIIDISLLPHRRNEGAGTALLKHCKHHAEGQGKPLSLQVERNNIRAQRLYQRLGFTVMDTNQTHIAMRWS